MIAMTRPFLFAAATLAGLLLAGPSLAQGSAEEGSAIAHRQCALCHTLPDGSGNAVGPDFVELAERGMPAATLQKILESAPHTGVVQATKEQSAEIAAWLESLSAP